MVTKDNCSYETSRIFPGYFAVVTFAMQLIPASANVIILDGTILRSDGVIEALFFS